MYVQNWIQLKYMIFIRPHQKKLAAYIRQRYPQIHTIELAGSVEEAGGKPTWSMWRPPARYIREIEEEWLKPGVYVSLPAGIDLDRFCPEPRTPCGG